MVMENVLKGSDASKWALTEVVEKGDGAWAKVRFPCTIQLPSLHLTSPYLSLLFVLHFPDLLLIRVFSASLTQPLSFSQGTTIEYAGARAGCSLASMGWTAKRGDVLPPVWVVVHKI